MNLLDLPFATPQENLACDEALLDWSEEESGTAILRFWESPRHFVALGYTDAASSEADVEACRVLDIPVLRRCSGGGTVIQGPGCLNYALVSR
jgi:lipoate-protein ligase A